MYRKYFITGAIFGSSLTCLLTNFYINMNYICIPVDVAEIYKRLNVKIK